MSPNKSFDSGCLRHMIEDLTHFLKLTSQDGEYVTFRDNNKRKIIGIGNISNKSNLLIKDVLLVDDLKYNLISISQLYDKGYTVKFESPACIIEIPNKNKSIITLRIVNVYTIDLDNFHDETYFLIFNNNE